MTGILYVPIVVLMQHRVLICVSRITDEPSIAGVVVSWHTKEGRCNVPNIASSNLECGGEDGIGEGVRGEGDRGE